MSIIGKMIIDGESFNLLSYNLRFYQQKDIAGRPRGRVNGGLIEVKIEAHRDHIFHHWTLQPEQMRDLEINFSPVTRVSSSRTIQLYDVYCAKLAVNFDNYTKSPMTYTLLLSPGIFVDGGVVFKKPWHVTDLSAMGGEEETDPSNENREPDIVDYYLEDSEGKKIDIDEIEVSEEIVLVIKTKNAVGETIELDLDDNKLDYEHNGEKLKDDLLVTDITNDIVRIPLKAIAQD